MKRKIAAYGSIVVASVLLILLVLSVWAIQAKGYVFFQDYLHYLMMALIVILYLVGWFLLVGDPDHKKNLVMLILFALLILMGLYGTLRIKRLQSVVVNDTHTHSIVLRYSHKKKLLDLYERKYFLLAEKIKTIEQVKSLERFEWLDEDSALLRYEDQSNTKRITPISFHRQEKSDAQKQKRLLLENWHDQSDQVMMTSDEKGVAIKWKDVNDYFLIEESVCGEDGTIVLYYAGNAKYILFPNADLKQSKSGAWKAGSVRLVRIEDEGYDSMTLLHKEKQESDGAKTSKRYEELKDRYGNLMQLEMQQLLLRDPTLTTYDDSGDYWQGKLQGTYADRFEVAFQMMRRIRDNQLRMEQETCYEEIHIHQMILLGGSDSDYLIRLSGTRKSACVEQEMFEESYRIMKGDQAYLGRQINYDINGAYGLSLDETPTVVIRDDHYTYGKEQTKQ